MLIVTNHNVEVDAMNNMDFVLVLMSANVDQVGLDQDVINVWSILVVFMAIVFHRGNVYAIAIGEVFYVIKVIDKTNKSL